MGFTRGFALGLLGQGGETLGDLLFLEGLLFELDRLQALLHCH